MRGQETARIQVDRVRFSYQRGREALSDITCEFSQGATVLLGPNGAGKSTLLALAGGVLKPSSGRIRLLTGGQALTSGCRAYRGRTAWLPQDFTPVRGLTLEEHVAYAGWLKGMRSVAARKAAGDALDAVGLGRLATSSVSSLSGGQTKRLGIAGALVHDADVVLLDEPFAGLDPRQQARLVDVIAELGRERAVVVSTHQTEDVGEIYTSVVVVERGRILFDGSLSEFAGRSPTVREAYFNLVAEED